VLVPARLRRVLATASLSAAFVAGATMVAAPAEATTKTVSGCFGVVVIYCDPTVEYVLPFAVGTTTTTIPVCAGTCTDVPVPVPTVDTVGSPRVCVTAHDRNGAQNLNTCAPIATPRLVPCSEYYPYYYDYTGYVVEDANGNVVLNGCVSTSDYTPYIEVVQCYDGSTGLYVYYSRLPRQVRTVDTCNLPVSLS
jgi:hypothetical protein